MAHSQNKTRKGWNISYAEKTYHTEELRKLKVILLSYLYTKHKNVYNFI